MIFEPRSFLVSGEWSSPNAVFDLSDVPPERANAVLVQWAMGHHFETALLRSEWQSWRAFMQDNAIARHRLYPFLDGSRLGRFEVFAAAYVAFIDEHLPPPLEIQQAVEGAKQRSRDWDRQQPRRPAGSRRRV